MTWCEILHVIVHSNVNASCWNFDMHGESSEMKQTTSKRHGMRSKLQQHQIITDLALVDILRPVTFVPSSLML